VRVREVAALVLSQDPLAPRLGAAERRRRMLGALAHARDRLVTCAPGSPLAAELETAARRLPRRPTTDELVEGLELVAAAQDRLDPACRTVDAPLDEALRVIVGNHLPGPA
jgi:hypothetical protein